MIIILIFTIGYIIAFLIGCTIIYWKGYNNGLKDSGVITGKDAVRFYENTKEV